MRNYTPLVVIFCLFNWLISPQLIKAAPQNGDIEYTDFLPKYRSISENFLLSKIEYTATDMIVFFRYVAEKDNDMVTFHGSVAESNWKLTSFSSGQTAAAYTVTRLANIKNIRLNDEFKAEFLEANAKKQVTAKKGDIITCELHFEMMPRTVRTVHLLGGDLTKEGNPRFNCNDILLKSKDSDLLGTKEQMDAVINRFYARQPFVNYPDIKNATTVAEQEALAKKDVKLAHTSISPLQKALEPIDYMPKTLNTIEDMDCNERIILSNVYFHDNKSEFEGRVKAMKTINVIIDYLNFYPKAKIVLHGHTDIFGNSFKNLELSKKRVETVKMAIAEKIDPSRIITVHHGGSQPLIQYKDGGELNRRVEAEIVCPGVDTSTSANK